MITAGEPPLAIRRATLADRECLFDWFNDPETRAASFSIAETTWTAHGVWLEQVLSDPRRWLYVVTRAGGAVGQARFDQRSVRDAEVSFSLAPALRGLNLAAPALGLATNAVLSDSGLIVLDAYVKLENERSRRAFARAGFVLIGPVRHAGQDALHLRLTRV